MITVRRAGVADVEAFVALRELMFAEIVVPSAPDVAWQGRAVEWFRKRIENGEGAAFVAETPEGELVASAFGEVRAHAPSPANPDGVVGHLSNVVVVAEYRRRGLARACVEHVLTWFREDTAVRNVDLAATEAGRPLYEKLGFTVRATPTMRLPLGGK